MKSREEEEERTGADFLSQNQRCLLRTQSSVSILHSGKAASGPPLTRRVIDLLVTKRKRSNFIHSNENKCGSWGTSRPVRAAAAHGGREDGGGGADLA